MGARTFEDIRAWQATYRFKVAIYRLLETGHLSSDRRLTDQLRDAARGAVSHITEGYGRFDSLDFARFVKMARASLMECQNHLLDAVDRRFIGEDVRQEHNALAQVALKEIGGMLDYLQSPEAKRNAERIRQARFKRRQSRKEPRSKNAEPGTPKPEPEPEPEREPGTRNREPGTS